MPGIEPGTFHMRSERSTTELHPRIQTRYWVECIFNMSQQSMHVLLELFAWNGLKFGKRCVMLSSNLTCNTSRWHWLCFASLIFLYDWHSHNISGDAGDRTRDLSHAKRTLYHWATSPVIFDFKMYVNLCIVYKYFKIYIDRAKVTSTSPHSLRSFGENWFIINVIFLIVKSAEICALPPPPLSGKI